MKLIYRAIALNTEMEGSAMFEQAEQDRLWSHYQNRAKGVFDLSYSRLRFLAERCSAGSRVLNIGVGAGDLERLLVARGVKTYALDPSAESIARLREELGLGDQAKQGYSSDIPKFDELFDKVIMTEVLEHLPDEVLRTTLFEIARVLKPGGEFTGTVPFKEDLQASEVICPNCQLEFHRWGHHQSFDRASFDQLLERHGFIVRHSYPRAFPDFRRPGFMPFLKSVFRYVLGRLGEPLVGPHLYFVAIVKK